MPLLEVEAKKLSNTDLRRGIIEEIIDFDTVQQFLPYVRTEGKAFVYNREGTLATAQFVVPNIDIPESASTFVEVTATLRIIAGDVDVDNFINTTYSDLNPQKSIQIGLKAKAVARLFSQKMISGDSSTVYNFASLGGPVAATNVEFDGLDVLCQGAMDYDIDTNGDVLSFDDIDILLDKVKLGCDGLMTSRRTMRDFRKLCRAVSSVTPEYIKAPGGQSVIAYDGKPILRNDFVSDTWVTGSSGAVCSSMYAFRFNEQDGVHGIYTGDAAGMQIIEIGQLEKRDATRTRIRWYVAMALKSTLSLAILRGIKAA